MGFIAFLAFVATIIGLIALIKGQIQSLRIPNRKTGLIILIVSFIIFIMAVPDAEEPTVDITENNASESQELNEQSEEVSQENKLATLQAEKVTSSPSKPETTAEPTPKPTPKKSSEPSSKPKTEKKSEPEPTPEAKPEPTPEAKPEPTPEQKQEFASSCDENTIAINSASFEELREIIHIDVVRAEEIIKMRASKPFTSYHSLQNIHGIGPKRMEDIKAQGIVCFD